MLLMQLTHPWYLPSNRHIVSYILPWNHRSVKFQQSNEYQYRADKVSFEHLVLFFGENCLTLAASHADIKTLDIILKNGVDLEIRGYQNETALISSAYSNHHQNLDFLLKNGADVSAVDNYGDSVMHKLARVGSLEMLKLVIESGIDKNAKGFNKHTALAINGVEFQEFK